MDPLRGVRKNPLALDLFPNRIKDLILNILKLLKLMEVMRVTWKDVRAGRVLVGSDRASLEGLVSSPFGYVPKKNADGSLSEEGRPIRDLQEPMNAGSPKELHPAVFTPAIRAGCLRVLVLQLLWPLLWVLLTKLLSSGRFPCVRQPRACVSGRQPMDKAIHLPGL